MAARPVCGPHEDHLVSHARCVREGHRERRLREGSPRAGDGIQGRASDGARIIRPIAAAEDHELAAGPCPRSAVGRKVGGRTQLAPRGRGRVIGEHRAEVALRDLRLLERSRLAPHYGLPAGPHAVAAGECDRSRRVARHCCVVGSNIHPSSRSVSDPSLVRPPQYMSSVPVQTTAAPSRNSGGGGSSVQPSPAHAQGSAAGNLLLAAGEHRPREAGGRAEHREGDQDCRDPP